MKRARATRTTCDGALRRVDAFDCAFVICNLRFRSHRSACSPAFPTRRLGVLFVVSGPSGSGKTTLCRQLTEAGETVYSVSATTRPPRPGEVHGRDYFFFSEPEFEQKLAQGEFFEHARVHGNLYGTLKSFVRQNLEAART